MSHYLEQGQPIESFAPALNSKNNDVRLDIQRENYPSWVVADVSSSFIILLAIFFPSVTGTVSRVMRSVFY